MMQFIGKKFVRNQRPRHSERGVAAVEFAIILPIFLLVLFGIVEFGGMMYDQQIIETAAREGARWGAAQSISANHPISCSDPVPILFVQQRIFNHV